MANIAVSVCLANLRRMFLMTNFDDLEYVKKCLKDIKDVEISCYLKDYFSVVKKCEYFICAFLKEHPMTIKIHPIDKKYITIPRKYLFLFHLNLKLM